MGQPCEFQVLVQARGRYGSTKDKAGVGPTRHLEHGGVVRELHARPRLFAARRSAPQLCDKMLRERVCAA
jgi:hypothetical protein